MRRVAISRLVTSGLGVSTGTGGVLRLLSGLKLKCLGLDRGIGALSNKRGREVGLTRTLGSGGCSVVKLSRPTGKLKQHRATELLGLVCGRISGDGGAFVVTRRSAVFLGCYSCFTRLGEGKRYAAVIFRNDQRRLFSSGGGSVRG